MKNAGYHGDAGVGCMLPIGHVPPHLLQRSQVEGLGTGWCVSGRLGALGVEVEVEVDPPSGGGIEVLR